MQSMPLPCPVSVSPTSLAAACARVPDPRRAASVIYPLPAMLALAAAAMLANHRAVLAIAAWGARQDATLRSARGFPTARTPCQSTLQRLFRQLDGRALADTLTACCGPSAAPPQPDPDRSFLTPAPGVAIDGKAQRGRLRFATTGCPVHALRAFCHDSGIVLAHEPIEAGLDKAEAELTVAPSLLARIAGPGRVLTGDALFCHRGLCQQVLTAGGAYLLLVKANQETLSGDIALLFDPPAAVPAAPLTDRRVVRTVESGHGRTLERRELLASTDLGGYLDWPGARQVFRLERTWREHGIAKRVLRYEITSLPPAAADPARLLALRRGHWAIENRLHRRKDVTFGEDASLIHVGAGPTVMALLRDAAVSLLHRAGVQRVASRLRTHSQHPERAVALVPGPLPTGGHDSCLAMPAGRPVGARAAGARHPASGRGRRRLRHAAAAD
jgi:predicted transposase YbfD/YdcC